MIPVFQTDFDESGTGPGNCMEAAVASLLEMSLELVPDFIECANPEYRMRQFLNVYGIEVINQPSFAQPAGLYFATGTSTQGEEHIVLMRYGRLVHDPNPHGRGLVHVDSVLKLRALTPAAARLVE